MASDRISDAIRFAVSKTEGQGVPALVAAMAGAFAAAVIELERENEQLRAAIDAARATHPESEASDAG